MVKTRTGYIARGPRNLHQTRHPGKEPRQAFFQQQQNCPRANHEHHLVRQLFQTNPREYHSLFDNTEGDDVNYVVPLDTSICPRCNTSLKYYLVHFESSNRITPWSPQQLNLPTPFPHLPARGWWILDGIYLVGLDSYFGATL